MRACFLFDVLGLLFGIVGVWFGVFGILGKFWHTWSFVWRIRFLVWFGGGGGDKHEVCVGVFRYHPSLTLSPNILQYQLIRQFQCSNILLLCNIQALHATAVKSSVKQFE